MFNKTVSGCVLEEEKRSRHPIEADSSSVRGERESIPKIGIKTGFSWRAGNEVSVPNLRFSPGKGQFFIVSAVIIASVLLIISHIFLGFSNISFAGNAEMSELEHIGTIKKSLNDTAAASACDRLEEDISAAEGFLSRKLAEQGIEMSAKHEIISCGNVRFDFNLTSQNFFSSTAFTYP